MKKIFLLLTLLIISWLVVKGQNPFVSCYIDFENNPCWEGSYSNISITGPNNIWQISTPNKMVFDSAYSSPRAILTDSTGPYPVNNTSSFLIKFVQGPFCMCTPVIGGYYKFDSDTLKDYGRIEFSVDHGLTWLNALSDTIIPDEMWFSQKPVFTGRIHQWTAFHALLLWNYNAIDTLYYRYTFVSDSIQTNHEGWMLDNIALIDHTEGTRDVESLEEVKIFPNPTSGLIAISGKYFTGGMEVAVYDIQGQLLVKHAINRNKTELNISGLAKGMYIIKVLTRNYYTSKLIIKD